MTNAGFDPHEVAYIPCAAAGVAAAVAVLIANVSRRRISMRPFLTAGLAVVAALVAWFLTRDTAFGDFAALAAWFGVLAVRARYEKIGAFQLLDAGAPAVAAAIAAMKLALFLTVESTGGAGGAAITRMPLYEFLVWTVVTAFLWRMGRRATLGPRPRGEVFAILLLLYGAAGYVSVAVLLRSVGAGGHSPEQYASAGTFAAGGIQLAIVLTSYHKVSKEHRILEHTAARGDVMQPEYRKPTPECPQPERWRMYDSMTAEVEVLEFLKTLVTTIKPELVVETGTFLGISTLHIAEGLKENGFGRVITCENDPKVFEEARKRFQESGLGEWIELRNESSLETHIAGRIDLLYCDSDLPLREQEVRRFLPQVNPHGLIVLHDASSALKIVHEGALKLEREGLLSVVFLPTPRGLAVAQKREG